MSRARRTWIVAVAGAIAACGKSGSDKASRADDEPERTSNATLVATKLEPFAGKVGAVAFTIDLPAAQLGAPEVSATYVSWEVKKAWMNTPSFSVTLVDVPLDADDTGIDQPIGDDAKDRAIVRAEKLPGGGFVHLDQRNDHAFFALEVCRPHAASRLCCTVIARDSKPIEAFAQLVRMAETVCTSMKIKT